ncbi:MAG: thioredoxin [Pyrinomonadaceae bacterium]
MPVVVCSNCGSKNRVNPQNAIGHIAKCGKCGNPLDLDATAGSAGQQRSLETKPLIVTDETFDRDVLGGPDVVLLDCWAPWCGPCRMVGPIMEQLAAESDGRYRIAKLNVDENPRISANFRIQSIPTMLIFKNGKLVDRLIGAQPKPAIAARLSALT